MINFPLSRAAAAAPGEAFPSQTNMDTTARHRLIFALILLLTALIFLTDLTTELGFAIGACYLTVVLLVNYLPQERHLILFAVLCSALILLGYLFSPEGGDPWKVGANRLISLYAVWATAIFSCLRRKSEQKREKLLRELESANKNLEGFSSVVSHDLRNPLLVIDGLSRRLLKSYADRIDPGALELIHGIRKSCGKANQLIADFLAFSRAGAREIQKDRIDMEALVKEVYEELESSAGREIRFRCHALPAAVGDRAMLHQVFTNLIANAIKFTGEKKDAVIEVGGSRGKAENIYYVKDNGAGFTMQSADKLFHFFQRLHDVRRFEGTGIGLAIVKAVIEKHGGRVWAEGKPDEGAVFYFSLPRKK